MGWEGIEEREGGDECGGGDGVWRFFGVDIFVELMVLSVLFCF